MAWIFQGNPNRFDIDDYLSRYPQYLYWRTNRFIKNIALGDFLFIWRSGQEAGAVALGQVVETPTRASSVKYPDALGDDLWLAEKADPSEYKTGVQLCDVRLSKEEGMITRNMVKNDSVLASSRIITTPNGTVFQLSNDEVNALMKLWGKNTNNHAATDSAQEGKLKLRAHYIRERSSSLRRRKLGAFREENGHLFCVICGFAESAKHPLPYRERAYEVHHRKPLGTAIKPTRTTLKDLAVLCANCHRAVHADLNVSQNYQALVHLYSNNAQ